MTTPPADTAFIWQGSIARLGRAQRASHYPG